MNLTILNTQPATGTTATTLGLARALAEDGQRVLIVDLDPSSGATNTLGLPSNSALYDFLFRDADLKKCLTSVRGNLQILCSGPTTVVAEERLQREPSAQLIFAHAFAGRVSEDYDFILFDGGSGLSLLQVAAVCYSRRILIPVTTSVLGVLGAVSAYISAQAFRAIYATEVEIIGYVPVMVNRDQKETEVTMKTISTIARECRRNVLPAIEYDESVPLAARNRMFVADFCAGSSATASYTALAKMLMDSVVARN
jgi:chromosome partitioning protein